MSARRGHNEGTIYKRPGAVRKDGSRGPDGYAAQLSVKMPDGKTRRATVYGKTRREVLDKLEAAKRSKGEGTLTAATSNTVADCLAQYLEAARSTVRVSTFRNFYVTAVKQLTPHVGAIRIDQLMANQIEHAYAQMVEVDGLSPRSVQIAHGVLRRSLRRAVQRGVIPSNPTDIVTPPRSSKREMQTLTLTQAQHFIKSTERDPLGPLYVLLITTGMRVGEALALTWLDVDTIEGTATVRRTVQRIAGQDGLTVGEPKSASSRRLVHLTETARRALKAQRANENEKRLIMGPEWQHMNLVFSSATGTYLESANVIKRFRRALAAAGLPALRTHDLRHTAATMALEQGVHPKIVQEMLGHSTYTLTMNTYSHVTPTLHKEAADAIDRALTSNTVTDDTAEGTRHDRPA